MAVASALEIILPKRKPNPKGVANTNTFNPQNPSTALTAPQYREHMSDIFDTRAAQDSRTLLRDLFKHDPDVSASVNAYLTVAASANPWWVVYDEEGAIDREGHKLLESIMQSLFYKNDYSLGFQLKPNLSTMCNELRYMALLRGGIGAELVLDKNFLPTELRHIDLSTVTWFEQSPGKYTPRQIVPGNTEGLDLNIPTFLVAFFKRDPTQIYSYSPFVSAINTIAARQQVINDLYRIMRKTGYPRQSIKVVEEVLRKNAPAEARQDEGLMNEWLRGRLGEIASTVSDLSVDQVYVHMDSVEPGVMNEKKPGMEIDIKPVIEVLNAQNQAALKTMATIIGRGESGVNTASVESRIFSMHADSLNQPVAQILSEALTLCLRLTGSLSRVEFGFDPVELRPLLELEPSKLAMQTRLLDLLSRGLISDDDFHMEMFSRPRPDDVPELSGTEFLTPVAPDVTDPATSGSQASRPDSVSRAAKSPSANAAKGSNVTRKAAS